MCAAAAASIRPVNDSLWIYQANGLKQIWFMKKNDQTKIIEAVYLTQKSLNKEREGSLSAVYHVGDIVKIKLKKIGSISAKIVSFVVDNKNPCPLSMNVNLNKDGQWLQEELLISFLRIQRSLEKSNSSDCKSNQQK